MRRSPTVVLSLSVALAVACNGLGDLSFDPGGSSGGGMLELGAACAADAACASGHCADGVCCDAACDAACQLCSTAGSAGKCQAAPAGTNPRAQCPGTATCTEAGVCQGALAWVVSYGDDAWQIPSALAVDAEGNVIVGISFDGTVEVDGPKESIDEQDALIVKLDASGKVQWSRHLPSEQDSDQAGYSEVWGLATAADGSVFATGWFDGKLHFGPNVATGKGGDIFVVKLTAEGDIAWYRTWGNKVWQTGRQIAVAPNGDVVVCGDLHEDVDFGGGVVIDTATADASRYALVLVLDPKGNALRAGAFGSARSDQGCGALAIAPNGDIVIGGSFRGSMQFGATTIESKNVSTSDGYLARLDNNLEAIWAHRFGDVDHDDVDGLALDASGGAWATGSFRGDASFGGDPFASKDGYDGYLVARDTDGDHVTSSTVTGAFDQNGSRIAVDAAGNILVGGRYEIGLELGGQSLAATAGAYDTFVAKLDAAGKAQWLQSFGGPLNDYLLGLAVAPDGSIVVAAEIQHALELGGKTRAGGGHSDAVVLKLAP
jgi:hypothetical protein